MKNLVFLSGEMGAGKTSIVNYYPHEIHSSTFFTSRGLKNNTVVRGWVSPGGKSGMDSIGHKNSKAQFFEEVLPALKEFNVIMHGTFYASIVDVERRARNHKVLYIILSTDKEEIRRRIEVCRGGHFVEGTYITSLRKSENILKSCKEQGLDYRVVDNNRPLEEVAKEVWSILDSLNI